MPVVLRWIIHLIQNLLPRMLGAKDFALAHLDQVLAGICITKSTHHRCCMSQSSANDEYLVVVYESCGSSAGDKLCRKGRCNSQFMCGCAAEASMLCVRHVARSMSIQTEVSMHSVTFEPLIV
jgi:hypothetical protein